MNKILATFLIPLFLCSCSLGPASSSSKSPSSSKATGPGYLKVKRRRSSDIINYDYLFVGEYGYEFTADGKTDDGKDASYTYAAKWESSNPESFVVDNRGIVKALKDGEGKLKATYGSYTDEIDIKVITLAETYEVKEVKEEYLTEDIYDIPIEVSPSNAFVNYYYSIPESVEILPNHKFKPLMPGSIDITALVYVNEYGSSRKMKFTINVIDRHAPYFTVNEEKVTSASIDIPVNKYKDIDYSQLGIKAYDGADGNEISPILIEGSYKLNEVGVYPIVLEAENQGIKSTLDLTINVIPREVIQTEVTDLISIECTSYEVNVINESTVRVTMSTTLPDDYEDYSGELIFYMSCQPQQKVSGRKIPVSKMDSKYLRHSTVKNFTHTFDIEYTETPLRVASNIRPDRYFVDFRGYGFNYVTYEPQSD